jgi:hypothetical protein
MVCSFFLFFLFFMGKSTYIQAAMRESVRLFPATAVCCYTATPMAIIYHRRGFGGGGYLYSFIYFFFLKIIYDYFPASFFWGGGGFFFGNIRSDALGKLRNRQEGSAGMTC